MGFFLKRLTIGYLLAMALIGILALASFAVLMAQINSQGRYATMISESSHQRTLSQRVAIFSLRLTRENDPERRREFRSIIERAVADIEEIQRSLSHGDVALGLAGPPEADIANLYERPPTDMNRQIRVFAENVRSLLKKTKDAPLDPQSPELAYILRVVPGEMLTGLEEIVTAYQHAGARATHRLQILETICVLLLLLTLAAIVQFVFRPLARSILRETREQTVSRIRLDAVLNTVGEAIVTTDAENVIVSANTEAERVWHRPAAELIGRRINTLVLPGRDLAPGAWRAVFPAGQRVETIGVREGGEPFPLELRLNETLLANEGPEGAGQRLFTVSARDISERVEAARQLAAARDAAVESARAKSDFVANMSHEIRTPMNGILGITDLLNNTGLSAEQRDFVETIRTSGDALLAIINDILDFSKMEAGKMSLETIGFELRQLVESTADLLAGRALQKHLELIVYVEPGTPTSLLGDPGRLRQVLLNLLGNAIKFTKTGEVILHVSAENVEAERATLRFSVKDTGVGIDPAASSRLFHAFSQADESTARRFGGTGLGLTISRQLVELMGGRIDLESSAGKGSTFWFTANFAIRPAARQDGHEQSPPVADTSVERLRGVRVLVVDDNASLRSLLQQRLVAWNMIADTAEDGAHTMALLREKALAGTPYDIALLDLNLGSIDGFTLAWAIKSQPMLVHTRLILVTSLGLESDRKAYQQVGIRASVTKPLKYEAVLNTLVQVLDTDPATEELEPEVAKNLAKAGAAIGALPVEAQNGRILLAEDNAINRKLALRQLANLGYHVDAVENGMEALVALDLHDYDVVLLDMYMPEMDGYQTAMTIRQHEADANDGHRTLIAMTASNLSGDRERCLAAGMDDFLSKPVRQEELARMLARWMPTDCEPVAKDG